MEPSAASAKSDRYISATASRALRIQFHGGRESVRTWLRHEGPAAVVVHHMALEGVRDLDAVLLVRHGLLSRAAQRAATVGESRSREEAVADAREPLTFQPGVTMSAAAAAAVVLISQNSTEATIAIPSKVRGPSSAAARCGLLAVERLPCVSRGSYASHCPCDFETPPWVFRYPETAPAIGSSDGDRSGAAAVSSPCLQPHRRAAAHGRGCWPRGADPVSGSRTYSGALVIWAEKRPTPQG